MINTFAHGEKITRNKLSTRVERQIEEQKNIN